MEPFVQNGTEMEPRWNQDGTPLGRLCVRLRSCSLCLKKRTQDSMMTTPARKPITLERAKHSLGGSQRHMGPASAPTVIATMLSNVTDSQGTVSPRTGFDSVVPRLSHAAAPPISHRHGDLASHRVVMASLQPASLAGTSQDAVTHSHLPRLTASPFARTRTRRQTCPSTSPPSRRLSQPSSRRRGPLAWPCHARGQSRACQAP